jgi:hypothetical protein
MGSIDQTLFGPLGKQYCLYFYIIQVILFILFLVIVVKYLAKALKMKLSGWDHLAELLDCFKAGVQYFVVRLLYSMCSGSLGV